MYSLEHAQAVFYALVCRGYELKKRFRKIGSDIRVSERRAQRLGMACLRKRASWAHSETFFLDTAHDAAPAQIECGELVEIERAGK